MFERLTEAARRAVVSAQEAARDFNQHHIGTEHLLLGLVGDGANAACQVLVSIEVAPAVIRDRVERTVETGETPIAGHIPFTPGARTVLQLTLVEALELGDGYIGTQHILLGLIREGEGAAAELLGDLGVTAARVHAQIGELNAGGAWPNESEA